MKSPRPDIKSIQQAINILVENSLYAEIMGKKIVEQWKQRFQAVIDKGKY